MKTILYRFKKYKMHPNQWIEIRPEGLYCVPAGVYVDPVRAVDAAIVTHGHADHARAGHGRVMATAETLAIMECRYGAAFTETRVPLDYGSSVQVGEVMATLYPAGHVLGSAQVLLEYAGSRLVVSGDYARRPNPTCKPFEIIRCDVFVTEATFALPVFRHPPIAAEVGKLIKNMEVFPDACHLVGAYALGKAQRVMAEIRATGYDRPFYLHGALVKLCELYREWGIDLGECIPVSKVDKKSLGGEIVLCPPGSLADRWSRGLPDVVTCMASGWMQIRARAKQRRVELPMVISDHADWDDLLDTIRAVQANEIWITHGQEAALMHAAKLLGLKAKPLNLVGFEEESE